MSTYHLLALESSPFSVAPGSEELLCPGTVIGGVEGCQTSNTGLRLGFANTGTGYSNHESNMPVSSGDTPAGSAGSRMRGMTEPEAAQDAN